MPRGGNVLDRLDLPFFFRPRARHVQFLREDKREGEREGERKGKPDRRYRSTCGPLTTGATERPAPNGRAPINRSERQGQTNLQSAGLEFDQAVIRLPGGQQQHSVGEMSAEPETDVGGTLGLLNRKMDVARPVKRHCKFNKFNAFRRHRVEDR